MGSKKSLSQVWSIFQEYFAWIQYITLYYFLFFSLFLLSYKRNAIDQFKFSQSKSLSIFGNTLEYSPVQNIWRYLDVKTYSFLGCLSPRGAQVSSPLIRCPKHGPPWKSWFIVRISGFTLISASQNVCYLLSLVWVARI